MESLRTNAFLPAYLRALIERPLRPLKTAVETAQNAGQLGTALRSALESSTIRYEWSPLIKEWPDVAADKQVFAQEPDRALALAVEIRTSKTGEPQSDVSAQLRNFSLKLLPGEPLMEMSSAASGFGSLPAANPRSTCSSTGWSSRARSGSSRSCANSSPSTASPTRRTWTSPPRRDGRFRPRAAQRRGRRVHHGEHLAGRRLPGAVPGRGRHRRVRVLLQGSPFRLTVSAIGGGGWVGIRLAPKGLVMLEMGLEAGAALSVDLGVASGSVSVMIGVYLRLEDDKGQLTAYFRIRGEVEVLGIASASITLELSLTYDFDSGKLIGRASLRVEVEVLFFSASVEITCERKFAGSKGDPALADIMPPALGGQALWDQYFSSFAIGA